MAVLAGLGSVDWVVSFTEDTPERLLALLQPDVLVKGGDYDKEGVVGWQIVEAYGGSVFVMSFVDDCSTTSIVDDSFDDKYIKGNIAKLKNLALAHRHSSIGRACFKDTKYQLAKHHYFTALSLKPSFAFNSNLVKRLVVSIIKCD